jgi:DNA-3-methyladenine glycosylase II
MMIAEEQRTVMTIDHVKARRHLTRRDPVLKQLIATVGACTLRYEPDGFAALVRSIVSQQISTRAAASIHGRLLAALGRRRLRPAALLALSDEELRGAGLSASKVLSLRDLAEKIHTKTVPMHRLSEMTDEEVIETLVPVRGIGRWTAQMFLIFSLGRADVLPVDDLGLRAGVQNVYQLAELPDRAALTEMAEPWRPYRSVATWYFWRSRGFVPQSE